MAHHFKILSFDGPLDLLLQLIEEQQLQISTISLAEVAEQFLQYLGQLEEARPEEMADFLVVASRLLVLKSKALLPYLTLDEEDDDGDLERQLRMYKEFARAAEMVDGMLKKEMFTYARVRLPDITTGFQPPTVTATDLRRYYAQVLLRLEPIVRLPQHQLRRTISISDYIGRIKARLAQAATVQFNQILAEAKDRQEVIVSFLALLELVKQRQVQVDQDDIFSPITIRKAT